MKIKIVKNQMGKTAEEIKPFPVVGPVPDDHILLNECELPGFWDGYIVGCAQCIVIGVVVYLWHILTINVNS